MPNPPNEKSDHAARNTNTNGATRKDPSAHDRPGNTNSAGVTFASQDELPKLPIPDLESTCKKYINALEPLQSHQEHSDTVRAVEDFLRSEGPDLNERLKKYASGRTSYIEQFWYDSYLNFDNPVVLNLNPFFLLEDDPTPARNNQVTRAASLVVSALSFVRAVRKEELPPDAVRDKPLCMYQFSRLFGTARVPTDHGCHIGQDEGAKHIVIICRGQFYWFDVLDDNSDLIMTEKDLALNLQAIVNDAAETPIAEAAKGALGVLSTENRKIWADLRDVLTREKGSANAECLRTVDSALFVLCLDHTEPATAAELCGTMLCGSSEVVKGVQIGTCTNRWYDKLQIIVCANGSAGINFEHTGVDGHTVLRFASDVYTDTILRFARSINGQAPSLWTSTSPDPAKRDPASFGAVTSTPHKLEWNVTPQLATALRFAETRLADLIQQNEFQTLEFGGYGKTFITSMGLSPDAFVQMAFQAAYYGLYGRVECTYEPAMTKAFLHGRTEAIRSVTPESVHFIQTFWGDYPAAMKVEALRSAAKKHVSITKECSHAMGQDRHLYALFCVWQRALDADGTDAATPSGSSKSDDHSPVAEAHSPSPHPVMRMPAIFADAGWDRLNNTILSTSNCGNPALRQFGFGPTSGDGFGIGYIIKDSSISICAASKHRQTRRFIESIESYFLEIRKLLRVTRRSEKDNGAKTTLGRDQGQVREAEIERGGLKAKGRAIANPTSQKEGDVHPEDEEEEDDGLGGYGFFDSGLLMQSLKANDQAAGGGGKDGNPGKEPLVAQARRAVGKKLRLSEY